MRILLLSFLITIFAGACAFAPITTTNSARSLGKSNMQIDVGFSPAPFVSFGYGFTQNFDAGILYEEQLAPLLGLWGQYSFINNPEKWSLALYGGVAAGSGLQNSTSYFIGPIVSYKKKWFETYLTSKYNYVDFKARDLTADEQDDFFIDSIDTWNISYIQTTLGMNFWFSDKFALNISAKHFYLLNSDANTDVEIVPGLGLSWRF